MEMQLFGAETHLPETLNEEPHLESQVGEMIASEVRGVTLNCKNFPYTDPP
jgi:hypothetical protein